MTRAELMAPRRVRVTVRGNTVYVDVDYIVDNLRTRARAYLDRAEQLTAAAADPASPVEPLEGDPVPVIEEALACRLVAEELNQRADEYAAIERGGQVPPPRRASPG